MVKKLVSKSEFARKAGVSAAAITKALRGALGAAADGNRVDMAHPVAVKYLQDKADAPTPITERPASGIDPLYEAAIDHSRTLGRLSISAIQRELHIGYTRSKQIVDMIKLAGIDISTPGNAPPPQKQDKSAPVVRGHTAKKNAKEADALQALREQVESGGVIHEIPDDLGDFVDMTLREILLRFGTSTAFLDWLKATKSIEDINEKRLRNAQTRGELVNRELIKRGVIEPFDTAFNKLLTDGAKTIARRVSAMTGAGRPVEDCENFVADQISSFIRPAKAKIIRTLKNA